MIGINSRQQNRRKPETGQQKNAKIARRAAALWLVARTCGPLLVTVAYAVEFESRNAQSRAGISPCSSETKLSGADGVRRQKGDNRTWLGE